MFVPIECAILCTNAANVLFAPSKNIVSPKKQHECLVFSFTKTLGLLNVNTMSLAGLRDTKEDLLETSKEAKVISNSIDVEYCFGSQAIEANFKKNADRYNIIHLALCGGIYNEHPENSKLLFIKSKDSIEDGYLYSHELFALDIPAELTVLSACNTGSGKIAKGEGVMSLGNAFQYAGIKSLLLSLWEVSDKNNSGINEILLYKFKNGNE